MPKLMKSKLQTKLTLSHLTVTLVSVLILAALVITGYFIYLQTNLPAEWAGDQAFFIADDIGYRVDVQGDQFDEAFSCLFIAENYGDIFCDTLWQQVKDSEDNDTAQDFFEPELDDWMVLISTEGIILGSNHTALMPVGADIREHLPPGFRTDWLNQKDAKFIFDEPETWIHFAIQDNHYIGQSAIMSDQNKLLGWVYFRGNGDAVSSMMAQAFVYLGGGLLVAGLVALLVSGIVSAYLSKSFTRRLNQLSTVSKAYATGDLSQRVEIQGNDEITQLTSQFNGMAEQISSQMKELKTLADKNAQLAEEARGLAQLEERNRLARDLHDAIKQQLFGLSLTAGSLQPLITKDPELARERLQQLSEMTQTILEEMDNIIKQLRPASLEDKGLVVALKELTEQWSEQTKIQIDIDISGERELPINIEQALYRITQEALNNIARHANAQKVSIELNYELKEVQLSVTDDGRGFDIDTPRSSQSLGLGSMEARATEVNGQLSIESRPQRGTIITVTIPSVALEVPHV